jgi:hypothetical protein
MTQSSPAEQGQVPGMSQNADARTEGWRGWMRRLGYWQPGRWANIGLPYFWLLLFFFLPFVIVLQISLAEPQVAQPPYSALTGMAG